jgi:hypothetical protein
LIGPALLFAVGGTAGVVAGPLLMDRFTSRVISGPAAWATALVGFITGVALSLITLAIIAVFVEKDSWQMNCAALIRPLVVASTTVVGYSLRAGK